MMKRHYFFTIFTFTLIFLITPYTVIANNEMQNTNGFIELDQVEPDNLPHITPYQKLDERNKDVKITYQQTNLKTKGFKFSFNPLIIDYGEISPTNPIIRTNILTIFNKASSNYAVFVYENNPLRLPDGTFIPPTSCDNGVCSAYRSGPWVNTLSFGLGYRCDSKSNNICQTDFNQANFFRQFPNKDNLTSIISGTLDNKEREAIITYKVNTAGAQPIGSYSNTIYYLAIPGY